MKPESTYVTSHSQQRPQRHPKLRLKPCSPILVVIACVALALALVGAAVAWAVEYTASDLTWYTKNHGADTFTVSTAGELRALSDLVGGVAVDEAGEPMPAESFAGKTVCLGGNIALFGAESPLGGEFFPIGSAAHPFSGTFDGQGHTVSGMEVLDSAAANLEEPYRYVGLFGYAGTGSTICNVTLEDNCRIALDCRETSQQVAYVGGIVGYSEGDVRGVTNRADITVVWDDGASGTGRGHDAVVVAHHVAGVAGGVAGELAGCANTGAVYFETTASSVYDASTGKEDSRVAHDVAGVAGTAGEVRGSTNVGDVTAYTTGTGGKDRFGETVAARVENVGGVVASTAGSVSGCANTAHVLATSYKPDPADAELPSDYDTSLQAYKIRTADGGGANTGGVVGAALADAPAQVKGCANTGSVRGLNNVGGVVGSASAATLVTECVNGDASKSGNERYADWGRVVSTRWNKPCTGGIVGNACGDVSYCRNHGQVDTGQAGYYIGGIVGNFVWQGKGTDAQKDKPELYSCYNTGQVDYSSSLRRGAIVGGSSGHVHDCLFLYGTLNRSEDAGLGAIGEDYGTYANVRVAYASARSARQNSAEDDPIVLTTKYATGFLNRTRADEGWDTYWVTNAQLNRGYPIIGNADAADGDVDLTTLAPQATLVRDARYTAAYNPTPTLKVTVMIDGEQIELVERADYIVVADPKAEGAPVTPDLAQGNRPYRATIQGIGAYRGAPGLQVEYGIEKGDFAECTVTVESATYTGKPMNDPKVTVYDAGGAVVPESDYAYTVNDGKDCVKPTTLGIDYRVVCDAAATGNYAGHTQGTYIINRIDIAQDCDVVGVTYDNRVWFYDDESYKLYEVKAVRDGQGNLLTDEDTGFPQVEGLQTYTDERGRVLTSATPAETDEAGNPVYGMQVEYTGTEVNPDVIGVLWNGEALPTSWYNVMKGAGDPSELSATVKNIEASTTGTLTVTYNIAYTKNYDIINFDINPVHLSADELSWESSRRTVTYLEGNPTSVPDITLYYGKNKVAAKNYTVEIAYSRDVAGNKHYGNDTSYALGSDLFYTIRFVDGGSIICDALQDIGPFTVAQGQVSLNEDYITVDFIGGSHQYSFAGVDVPDVELTNTATGAKLVEGEDYELVQWSYNDREVLDWVGATPYVRLRGMGSYTGGRHERFFLEPVPISNATFDTAWPHLSADGRAMIQNCYAKEGYVNIGDYNVVLPYRSAGYDADSLGSVLGIAWRPAALEAMRAESGDPATGGYFKRGMFAVEAMRNESGKTVKSLQEPGLYEIDIVKDPLSESPFFDVSSDFAVTRKVEVVPIHLGHFNSCFTTAGEQFDCVTYHAESLLLNYRFGAGGSADKGPLYEVSYDGTQCAYTGNPVLPKYAVADSGLLETPLLGRLTIYPSKGTPAQVDLTKSCIIDPADLTPVVAGYPESAPVEAGEYQVIRVMASPNSKHVEGGRNLQVEQLPKNRFQIVPADISDADLVTIKADAPQYTGKPVQPTLHFFIDGEECNYVFGEDYAIECSNNVNVASATGDDPPLATVKILNKNHLVAHDGNGNEIDSITVPFGIDYAVVDMNLARWEVSPQQALADGASDGSLAGASVQGSYELADERYAVPPDVYAVEAGTVHDGAFTPQAAGWKVGDEVSYRITANGTNPVFTGQTVVGPARVVEAGAANSFSRIGQQGCELSATLDAESFAYAGVQLAPEPTVTDGETALVRGVDYELGFGPNQNVLGGGSVTVRGIGRYTGSYEMTFAITPVDLAACAVRGDEQVYSGERLAPDADAVHVFLGDVELPSGDWALVSDGYGENIAAGGGGLLKVSAGASGNVVGEQSGTFAIAPLSIDSDRFAIEVGERPYTGEAVVLDASDIAVRDTAQGTDLEFGDDFVVNYLGDSTSAGARDIIVSGVGNYTGNRAATFTVAPRKLEQANVKVAFSSATYTGAPIEPPVEVKVEGAALEQSYTDLLGDTRGDFTVAYENNVNAGDGPDGPAVVVSGIGNYAGEVRIPFAIGQATMSADNTEVTLEGAPFYYDGAAHEPKVAVVFDGTPLAEGDYTLDYSDNVKVGSATVVVKAAGPNFNISDSQQVTATFAIEPARIATCTIEAIPSQPYAFGTAIEPAVTVVARSGEPLQQGTDYEVAYADNTDVGTATATVTGIGNWAGSQAKAFRIARIGITTDAVTLSPTTFTYDGHEHVPAVSVVVGGRTLREGTDYTVRFLGDKTSAGSQVIEITTPATSVYWSSATAAYSIEKAEEEPEDTTKPSGDAGTDTESETKPADSQSDGNKTKPGDSQSTESNDTSADVKKGTARDTGSGSGVVTPTPDKPSLPLVVPGNQVVTTPAKQAANPVKVKVKTIAAKKAKLRKKAQVVKPITVTKAQGKVTFKKTGGSKKLSVNKKTGKVTVKKKTKRGTYKIKVKVSVAGNAKYLPATKTVTAKVKVK